MCAKTVSYQNKKNTRLWGLTCNKDTTIHTLGFTLCPSSLIHTPCSLLQFSDLLQCYRIQAGSWNRTHTSETAFQSKMDWCRTVFHSPWCLGEQVAQCYTCAWTVVPCTAREIVLGSLSRWVAAPLSACARSSPVGCRSVVYYGEGENGGRERMGWVVITCLKSLWKKLWS